MILAGGWSRACLGFVAERLQAFDECLQAEHERQFLGQLDELWDRLFGFAERAREALGQYEWFNQLMPSGDGLASNPAGNGG